jgi:hypothetical protein
MNTSIAQANVVAQVIDDQGGHGDNEQNPDDEEAKVWTRPVEEIRKA